MPIPKHLRHLYRGPEYKAWRKTLLDRSHNKCEQCGKPNGERIQTITGLHILALRMAWRRDPRYPWRDQRGKLIHRLTYVQALRKHLRYAEWRDTTVVLTACKSAEEMLCQWCSLNRTQALRQQHAKETREKAREEKQNIQDAERPLLCAFDLRETT